MAVVVAPATLSALETVAADPFLLVMEARTGVPVRTAMAIAGLLQFSLDELAAALHTTTKTLRNHREAKKSLPPPASEQVLKLVALRQQGLEVFGDATVLRRWLDKPAYGLAEQVPLSLLQTSGGIDLVIDEISRIAHGDFA